LQTALHPRIREVLQRLRCMCKASTSGSEGSASSEGEFKPVAGRRLPFAVWRAMAAWTLAFVYELQDRKVLNKVSQCTIRACLLLIS
jgi:hypothetical protein